MGYRSARETMARVMEKSIASHVRGESRAALRFHAIQRIVLGGNRGSTPSIFRRFRPRLRFAVAGTGQPSNASAYLERPAKTNQPLWRQWLFPYISSASVSAFSWPFDETFVKPESRNVLTPK